MKQAAFDVLLNKKNWQSPDTERRALWSAPTGTTSDSSDVFLTKGQEASIAFQLTDLFGAYPFDLSAGLPSLPEGRWFKAPPQPAAAPPKTNE